jgi:hypothetical protein
MKRILILINLLLILSYCTNNAPSHITTGDTKFIKVLSYGYPTVDYYQRNKVAKKYGYSIIPVAGCEVSQMLIDSVKILNEIAYNEIEKINGKDWREKYEIDVENEFKLDTLIINEVEKLDFIMKKNNELSQSNNGLHFHVDSILENEIYRVNVSGYDVTTVKYENVPGHLVPSADYVSYFRIFYNYKKHMVDSVDNKILFMFKGK